MLKSKVSDYQTGRPKGPWYKFKRDPFNIDAVLLYAQRGHGKRSSLYSDYTFGVWKNSSSNKELVTVGKAYSGFTDKELIRLDKFIRTKTIGRFGPVREVEKSLVFEVSFDMTVNIGASGYYNFGNSGNIPSAVDPLSKVSTFLL